MRSFLVRFALWLCRSLVVDPIASNRILAGGDAIERGARWEQFYREAGGLKDMLLTIRRGYFEAASALPLSDRDKHYEYALADRIARELEREILGVVVTGKAKAEQIKSAEREKAARILRAA